MSSQEQKQISPEIQEKQISSQDRIIQESQQLQILNNEDHQDNIHDNQSLRLQNNDSKQLIQMNENIDKVEYNPNEEQEQIKEHHKQNDNTYENKEQNSKPINQSNLINQIQQNLNDVDFNKEHKDSNEVCSTSLQTENKLEQKININNIESPKNIQQTNIDKSKETNSGNLNKQNISQVQNDLNKIKNSSVYNSQNNKIAEDNYYNENSFNQAENRKMLEDLHQRIGQLHQNIDEIKKHEYIFQTDEYILKYLDNFNNKISKQEHQNSEEKEISNDYIKQRAYELLTFYHSEIQLLQQQKQNDNLEIQRLKSIIKDQDIQNKILTEKIFDLENQLKQQLTKQNDQNYVYSFKNLDLVNQQQNTSSDTYSPIKIEQVKSIYYDDISQSNGSQKRSQSVNKDSYDKRVSLQIKNKQNGNDETQTSYNLSPSPVKNPMILKKLNDSFYSNKKRLSTNKEQNHNILIPDQNKLDYSGVDMNTNQISKLKIQMENSNHDKKQNQIMYREQEKLNTPPIKVKTYAIKLKNARINSLIGQNQDYKSSKLYENKNRSSLNMQDEDDSFWKKTVKDNTIDKVINRYSNQVKQQNQLNISQNKSLWINNIDFEATGYFKDISTSPKQKQINNERSSSVNNSYKLQPQSQQSKQPQELQYQLQLQQQSQLQSLQQQSQQQQMQKSQQQSQQKQSQQSQSQQQHQSQQKPINSQNKYKTKQIQDQQLSSSEINRLKGDNNNKNNFNIGRTRRSFSNNQHSNNKLDPLKPSLKQITHNEK